MANKNNISKFPAKPELVERWDLFAASMTDTEKVQDALEEGYEPFSVTNQMKKVEASAIATPGQPPAGGMVMDTLIWLKRKTFVPLVPESPKAEPAPKIEAQPEESA